MTSTTAHSSVAPSCSYSSRCVIVLMRPYPADMSGLRALSITSATMPTRIMCTYSGEDEETVRVQRVD